LPPPEETEEDDSSTFRLFLAGLAGTGVSCPFAFSVAFPVRGEVPPLGRFLFLLFSDL